MGYTNRHVMKVMKLADVCRVVGTLHMQIGNSDKNSTFVRREIKGALYKL